jgi:hypothetical protein
VSTCAQLTASTSTSTNPYCQAGNPLYNASTCAQITASTTTNTSTSPYCQAGNPLFNPATCAQVTAATTTNTNPYCQAGITYNPTLCTQGTTGTSAAVSDIAIQPNPSSINCGSAATVNIRVSSAIGVPVPYGTTVNLTASPGTISPTSMSLNSGVGIATYTAPATGSQSSGTATITAAAGGVTRTGQITLNCTGTAAPAAPVAAVPAPIAAAPVQAPISSISTLPSSILPPSTGDGGLLNLLEE